jgi:alcohol dehydrogenase
MIVISKKEIQVIVTGYDLGMDTAGGFGEYIRVPASWVIKLPNGLSERDSMTLGTAGLTAGLSIQALDDYNSNNGFNGLSTIVTGSTGGVGSIAVMLLSKLDASVTAVTGKSTQKELLQSLGLLKSFLEKSSQSYAELQLEKRSGILGWMLLAVIF